MANLIANHIKWSSEFYSQLILLLLYSQLAVPGPIATWEDCVLPVYQRQLLEPIYCYCSIIGRSSQVNQINGREGAHSYAKLWIGLERHLPVRDATLSAFLSALLSCQLFARPLRPLHYGPNAKCVLVKYYLLCVTKYENQRFPSRGIILFRHILFVLFPLVNMIRRLLSRLPSRCRLATLLPVQ